MPNKYCASKEQLGHEKWLENIKQWNYQFMNAQHNAFYKLFLVEDRMSLHTLLFLESFLALLTTQVLWSSPTFIPVVTEEKRFLFCWPSTLWWVCLLHVRKVPRKQHDQKSHIFSLKVKPQKEKKKAQSLMDFKDQSYSGQKLKWGGPAHIL